MGRPRSTKASGVSDWTLHDLGRSARSLMSRAGVSSDHAERVLGHAIAGDRHAYKDEKRLALAALARLVGRILSSKNNVIPLREKKFFCLWRL